MPEKTNKRVGWVMLGLIVALSLGIVLGKGFSGSVLGGETYEDLKVFTEALALIQKNYVEEIDSKDLVYGAVRGMVNQLDPHTSFMTPSGYKEMQVDTKGEFGGLGIQISMKDKKLVVISPIEDTPADRAGIKAGDHITKIDDVSTLDMDLNAAVEKMRGPKGTKVTLTIAREGTDKPLSFTLIRDIIKIKSVKHKMLDDHIGYVRISQFQEQTAEDTKAALSDLKQGEMHSLILDLRNNPGGLLKSAIDVSEQFLPDKKMVVYVQGRKGDKEEYFSSLKETGGEYPMVILVNEGSASASEIVSGALQDWGRAVILGAPTFGKGSVQTIFSLHDGSGLRLTTAKYYTPKGRSIQNTGIAPDIVVKLPTAKGGNGDDLSVLREKDLKRHLGNETAPKDDEETSPDQEKAPPFHEPLSEDQDVQLQRAEDLLKGWTIFKGIGPSKDGETPALPEKQSLRR
jgi:carboxyl-terminal processing protease